MALKIFQLNSKKYLFNVDFLEDIGSSKVSGEKAIVELEKLPKDISSSPLIETLKASLRRYMITDNVQNTSDAINVSVNNLALKLVNNDSFIVAIDLYPLIKNRLTKYYKDHYSCSIYFQDFAILPRSDNWNYKIYSIKSRDTCTAN